VGRTTTSRMLTTTRYLRLGSFPEVPSGVGVIMLFSVGTKSRWRQSTSTKNYL
jgi:hypothetical protein